MKHCILIILLLVFLVKSSVGQTHCGTQEAYLQQTANNPILKAQYESTMKEIYEMAEKNPPQRTLYTVPVVVHIVYKNASENIPDSIVYSQISRLNEDFRKLNADTVNIPPPFKSLAADSEIMFELASQDPSGNFTNGITRTFTDTLGFSSNNHIKFDSTGGKSAWPSHLYLNIWLGDLQNGLIGYAQFPGGVSETDGIVVHYQNFGVVNPASTPYYLGRTAVHEIAHWLGLRHIWGDDGGACSGTDNIADTPNQAGENYGCPTFPNVSCSNGPDGDMFVNYLDYSDDACLLMFTHGQKTVMQTTLSGIRAGLINNGNTNPPTSISQNNDKISVLNLFPNPSASIVHLSFYSNQKSSTDIFIVNSEGKTVSTFQKVANEGKNEWDFPIESLSNGIYYIQLSQSGIITHQHNFIK